MEFTDDYDHSSQDVFYFSRNIPIKEAEDLYQDLSEGCNCIDKCDTESCPCIKKSGSYYEYSEITKNETYTIREKDPNAPIYECSSNCACFTKLCGNKLVQCGPRKNLIVKLCTNQNKGYGLFTLHKIYENSFICEYAGEIITEQEASKRFQIYKASGKMNYIFCINETFGDRLVKTFIDPTIYGNIGRYINHSCRSNCKLIIIRENTTMPILAVFSRKDIEPGDEITYDYGEESSTDTTVMRKPCFCGEEICRKYLPYDPQLT